MITNLSITEQKLRTLVREEMRAALAECGIKQNQKAAKTERERLLAGEVWISTKQSSLIESFAYTGRNLLVKFKSSGRTYQYVGVPGQLVNGMYDSFISARSVGSYFLRHIRDEYKSLSN